MSQFNFADLMKQAGSSFEPLGAGTYEAVIKKAEAVRTATGKTMFKLTWSITQGPFTNRKVWSNQVISPESPPALGIFFRHMAALGLDATFFGANPSPDQVAAALVNRPAQITVSQREYQGQLRNDVTDIKQGTGGGGVMTAMGFPPPAVQQMQAPAMPPQQAPMVQQPVPQMQAPQQAPQMQAPQQPVQQQPVPQMQIPQPASDPAQMQQPMQQMPPQAGPGMAAPPMPF